MFSKIKEFFYVSSERFWDITGVGFGALGCFAILGQIYSEFVRKGGTSLSAFYLIGYLLIFGFWLLYGLRFKRPAIIITNGLCVVFQLILTIVALSL